MDSHKAVCFTYWFQGHNNVRYAELFPRLSSVVDVRKVVYSRHRIVRGAQHRLWQRLRRRVVYPMALRRLRRKFHSLFTIDGWQIPFWDKGVVADMDDPRYSATEVSLLNLPQVKAIVVTTGRAKDIFRQLGVKKPIHVVPQGVSVKTHDAGAQRIRRQFVDDSDIVVGYLAPNLTLANDRPRRLGRGEYDLDFLFAALEGAVRVEPRIRLLLVGRPSPSVMQYAKAAGDWVKLMGYVPHSEVLDYVAAFDIGVYTRARGILPPGRFNMKVAQYMACGIPVVSTDTDEASIIRESNCGIVCRSQEEFSRTLVNLASYPQERKRLGESGRAYANSYLEWSHIVPRYEQIIRDVLSEKP